MYQKDLALNTLYEAKKFGFGANMQLAPSLEIAGGTVTVYGSNKDDAPTALADMSADADNPDISGLVPFALVPKYLAFTGTATRVTIVGIQVKALGTIV